MCWFCSCGKDQSADRESSYCDEAQWPCPHYIIVSKFQCQPFWLVSQLCPQNSGWQNRVYYDVFAQPPLLGPRRKCSCSRCDTTTFISHFLRQGSVKIILNIKRGKSKNLQPGYWLAGVDTSQFKQYLSPSPVILWTELGSKSKWLPLKFGYHDVMRTGAILLIPNLGMCDFASLSPPA